ncbi:hypothetical protein COY33_01290 [candidate division WWE3 bacterium CG_4_10_14_0_2_um_filter_42_7]|uniref:Peptidase MA-like domain-containing protein n=2 Tax=Katanobacteria TaxID=422282 RepID=A0A2H0X938_UNCKA|nr:MAG: hypothetical protein COT51_03135 [candidate division WWE3 bacterium CG08_land_8_20_14_0_20_41_15]PIZ43548.1 MAG: hypothetical protein COY33_01290 [candidate division WWE3 bacterium CG_4_10_14_0_2_um_filter_42_7]
MNHLPLTVCLVFAFTYLWIVIEFAKKPKKRRKTAIDALIFTIIIVLLFLFGPLIAISPIKPGYETRVEGTITIIYPNAFSPEADRFLETTKKAERNMYSIYQETYPVKIIWAKSSFDMMRFVGRSHGGAAGLAAIVVSPDRMDEGVLTHELSHRYLQQKVGKLGIFFPRWFDEGLATYLGHTDSMAKYTSDGIIRDALQKGLYQKDLSYWNGLIGYIHWLQDVRKRPMEIYSQSYFLIKYLADTYGEEKLKSLIEESKSARGFDEAFFRVYQLTVNDFHQSFLAAFKESHQMQGETNL